MAPSGDLEIVENPTADLNSRIDALTRLSARDDPTALETLIRIATDVGADPGLSAAAGGGVARVLARQGRINDAPLPWLTGPAFLEFDRVAAESEGNRTDR